MEKTYWNNCGTYAEAVAKLQTLIPDEGACSSATTKNKALDRFRRASNCYYDLYNNGLCNRARANLMDYSISMQSHDGIVLRRNMDILSGIRNFTRLLRSSWIDLCLRPQSNKD